MRYTLTLALVAQNEWNEHRDAAAVSLIAFASKFALYRGWSTTVALFCRIPRSQRCQLRAHVCYVWKSEPAS
jgi:hypothetical protein